ncbi:hypothetical protein HYC85_017631 [Camellia sinensis]|uniref:Cystatin domain-containing protein n=1 Tax=Camellia sinensis TaxID=4442 RepID=A0A7J7GVS7_CAMSI|nr:hypothetical protein HYC85_017631 [Camellia sinensis]
MTLKSQSQATLFIFALFVITFVLTDVSAAQGGRKPLLGGWTPIQNVSSPEVQEVARFAVSEHNKEANTNLKLQKVVSGETQVVSGTNYKLVIATADGGGGGGAGNYEAVVWVKPWENYKNLTSFKKL